MFIFDRFYSIPVLPKKSLRRCTCTWFGECTSVSSVYMSVYMCVCVFGFPTTSHLNAFEDIWELLRFPVLNSCLLLSPTSSLVNFQILRQRHVKIVKACPFPSSRSLSSTAHIQRVWTPDTPDTERLISPDASGSSVVVVLAWDTLDALLLLDPFLRTPGYKGLDRGRSLRLDYQAATQLRGVGRCRCRIKFLHLRKSPK